MSENNPAPLSEAELKELSESKLNHVRALLATLAQRDETIRQLQKADRDSEDLCKRIALKLGNTQHAYDDLWNELIARGWAHEAALGIRTLVAPVNTPQGKERDQLRAQLVQAQRELAEARGANPPSSWPIRS